MYINFLQNQPTDDNFLIEDMLANSIHPGLPQMPPFGRHRVGLGELARLKTWTYKGKLIQN